MNHKTPQIIAYQLLLFALAMTITSLATFTLGDQYIRTSTALVVVFWLAALAGGLALYAWTLQQRPAPFGLVSAIAVAAVLAGCVHIAVSYLQEISTYPLTLSWSEASRYYYASLFFSERIYGTTATPTVLHPSRYLLQAAPFLIPTSPIWLHRAWQVFLWLAMPAAACALLTRRIAPVNRVHKWLLAGAFYLYLFVGPVYYHLIVPVIVILWGFDTRQDTPLRRWRSIAALLIASAWCGISRVNWFPAAGLLASALFLMEQPTSGVAPEERRAALRLDRAAWRYFLKPVGWTLLGTLTAFLAQIGYITWSGNAVEQFASSFFSDLLWHRLLPNPTYPPGLLLAATLVSLPLALILAGRLLAAADGVHFIYRFHPLRLLALAASVVVLLAGGLLVSIKIGGGNNLHNLDLYLTLLAVITAYFAFNRAVPDTIVEQPGKNVAPTIPPLAVRIFRVGFVMFVAVVPTFAVYPRGPVGKLPSKQATAETIKAIAEAAAYVHDQGRDALFIGERQLLTFHTLQGIPLVAEYERVFLMEAAMAGDENYLQGLYYDLKQQRYGLIVSEPLSKKLKDTSEGFAAENNAWVKRISRRVLCYYEPVKTFNPTQVQLLAPRAAPGTDCH